ncbi:class I SAM-dependent methyltransferase [Elusimicrobiota bacterium]
MTIEGARGEGCESCMICGATQFGIIGRPRPSAKLPSDTHYRVLQCKSCLFYFVSPAIDYSKQVWEELYGQDYFGQMTRWWAKKRASDRRDRCDLLEMHSQTPIKTFLDIGSGEGYLLVEAARRGWETHGIDISDNRIEEARHEGISFVDKPLVEAGFSNDYFDCVYMDSVLEHVLDPLSHLKELNRVMKDNGVLYIGVPNEDSLFNDTRMIVNAIRGYGEYSARIKPFEPPYHVAGFTRETLTVAAPRAGFKIEELRNFGGHYEFLKFPVFTKPFLMEVALTPIHLIAIPLAKQTYLDAIFRKVRP